MKTQTHHSPDATVVLNKAKDLGISFNEVSIAELLDSEEYAAAVEALQVAQQKMQDDPRNQRTTRGKPRPETYEDMRSLPGWAWSVLAGSGATQNHTKSE